MKNDLKIFFSAAAIYLGLLLGAFVLFIALWLLVDKYPAIEDAIYIFGAIYYLVFFAFLLIRRLINKRRAT